MTTENSSADALTILARIIELDDGKMRMAHKPHPERSQEWKAYAAGLPKLLSQARAILAALPVEQPVAAPKFDKQKMLASAREHGMDLGDNPVAYEFYNKATGHAVVDYTRWTHRGHLTEKDGYEARPLVYAHAARAQPAPSPADERAAEAMAIPYGHEFADTIQCQAHSGPDCTECGGTGVWSAQADARVGLTFDKWWSVGGWRLVSQAGDKNGWRGAAEAGYEAGYIGGLFAAAAAVTKPEPRAEVTPFADNDERDEFIRACQDFDDDGETCVDYGLLMKWAGDGLLDCDHFTITKKGRSAIDAAREGGAS
jgi:hypothetical protein